MHNNYTPNDKDKRMDEARHVRHTVPIEHTEETSARNASYIQSTRHLVLHCRPLTSTWAMAIYDVRRRRRVCWASLRWIHCFRSAKSVRIYISTGTFKKILVTLFRYKDLWRFYYTQHSTDESSFQKNITFSVVLVCPSRGRAVRRIVRWSPRMTIDTSWGAHDGETHGLTLWYT